MTDSVTDQTLAFADELADHVDGTRIVTVRTIAEELGVSTADATTSLGTLSFTDDADLPVDVEKVRGGYRVTVTESRESSEESGGLLKRAIARVGGGR